MKNNIIILIILISVIKLFAQNEFLVNTYLDSTQRDPQIDRDSLGSYVVVWNSEDQISPGSKGDIYLQLFDSTDQFISTETLVNTRTAGDQEKPALAMNKSGGFVIVWASYTNYDSVYDIKARVYQNGVPITGEILVNSTIVNTQTNPDVAINENGDFIVVWDSWYQDGSDRGVFAQRFDQNGGPVGGEFQVNSTVAYSQTRPAVRYFSDGRFLVIWESWKQDMAIPSGYGIFGQIFNPDASLSGGEFQINTYTKDYQWFGDLHIFNDNSFVVVWCSWEQDGYDGGIYLQKFDSFAQPVGNEILVNKTKVFYQWLPKILETTNHQFAVVWSSWKQDGSREGVYCQYFDNEGRKTSFEMQVNSSTEGYQWEPDAIPTNENEILVVWSGWGEYQKDYEIKARRISPQFPQGILQPSNYSLISGRSTSDIIVHVVDSTALTGNTYQLSFSSVFNDTAVANIKNMNTAQTVVNNFMIEKGEGIFYLTPEFDGLRVEIIPEFDLELDFDNSFFLNNSGANLIFDVRGSQVGTVKIAPIDLALIWGNTDTLANGNYATPLDSALGFDGMVDIQLPFFMWNLTDGEKVDLLVVEEDLNVNNRWEPRERIIVLTPVQYRNSPNNTHVQINTALPSGNLLMPSIGDTNFVFTTRPLSMADTIEFTADPGNIVSGITGNLHLPERVELLQNYPNPFNPVTTIPFRISEKGKVKLDIFNLLGQKVKTVFDGKLKAGYHRISFDGKSLASGIYIYEIQYKNYRLSRKMLLIK